MKCPQCVKEGLKSFVYPGLTSRTVMPSDRYYDEDGIYHCHDPNYGSTDYVCSNSHTWIISKQIKCPNCDYSKEKKDDV